eukprot:355604-Chlamydomonas_euryale.AAC.9
MHCPVHACSPWRLKGNAGPATYRRRRAVQACKRCSCAAHPTPASRSRPTCAKTVTMFSPVRPGERNCRPVDPSSCAVRPVSYVNVRLAPPSGQRRVNAGARHSRVVRTADSGRRRQAARLTATGMHWHTNGLCVTVTATVTDTQPPRHVACTPTYLLQLPQPCDLGALARVDEPGRQLERVPAGKPHRIAQPTPSNAAVTPPLNRKGRLGLRAGISEVGPADTHLPTGGRNCFTTSSCGSRPARVMTEKTATASMVPGFVVLRWHACQVRGCEKRVWLEELLDGSYWG